MDLATAIGLLAGAGMLLWALWSGGDIGAYWNTPSVVLVAGGSVFVVLTTQALDRFIALFAVLKRSLLVRRQSVARTIEQIIQLGELARREGVLSLENTLDNIEDDFLSNGIRLVIDGTAAGEIEQMLAAELDAMDQRHGQGKGILETFGKYAPALGMIGTLIGLVQMLQSMEEPSSIGPAMAVALLTTFYGSVMANLIYMPIAGKLRTRSKEETLVKEMVIQGVISLTKGENPRILEQKMLAFMAPRDRQSNF